MTKPTGRPRGRPRKNPAQTVRSTKANEVEVDDLIGDPEGAADDDGFKLDVAEVYGGVSANWLAMVFGHDKNTIKKKLAAANIEIVGRRNGGPLYRISDAAQYLVKPRIDLVSYVKSLRPGDLPPILNDAYWSAMLKRQKWEENAGDLWRTESVLNVFGDLALSVKTTVNLWVEEVDRQASLTPEQRAVIRDLCDKLLEQVYEQMVEAPKKRKTTSTILEEDQPVQEIED